MILNDFMRVTVEMSVQNASNPVVMVWDMQCIATTATFDLTGQGEVIVEAFLARHYAPMRPYMSTGVIVNHVSLRSWADPTDGYDAFGTLDQGTAVGAMLPPFVATSIQLTRANYAMRNGRKAYPGPTVALLTATGTFDTSARAAIGVITQSWVDNAMLVEGEGADITFQNRIIRVPTTTGVNPTVSSLILGYGGAKFGSQNSRKS